MLARILYEGKKVEINVHNETEYISSVIIGEHSFYEMPLLKYLKQYNPKCFVDIGANIGNHSLFFHLNGTKEVHAFEPEPKNYALLEKNCPFAHLYNVAIGDENGRVGTKAIPRNMGASQVIDGDTTDIRTLDSYNLSPDLIKIDAEYMEIEVVRGAMETLKKHKPRLVIEHNDLPRFYATMRLLTPLGYTVKPFIERGWEVFEYVS